MGITAQKANQVSLYWKVWQVLLATLGLAVLIAYPIGMLLNTLLGNGANCADLVYLGCGGFPDPFTYFFGLIYALPFWLGVFHFGFTDKKRWWYYILAALLAKFLYVGSDSLIYAVAAIGGGAVAGLVISTYRNKKAA